MKRYISLSLSTLLFGTLSLNALTYEEYKAQQNSQYKEYVKKDKESFMSYKEAYEKAFSEYKDNILKNFNEAEISSQKVWVEYNKEFDTKKKIDFENQELTFEVVAKDEKEAKEKFLKLSNEVQNDSVKSAYENDQVEQKVIELTNEQKDIKSDEKIIADVVPDSYVTNEVKKIDTSKLQKAKVGDKFVYKLNVKLPSDTLIKKAKLYKDDVLEKSSKNEIPPELTYAIIHSESSFNPMARSHIPAFGLMQIVPKSAGVDTYEYLYGQKKILSSEYLYNPQNNINIGATYLHIIYSRYMRKIEDPISRMYCTIAAYNTGAGNVAKAFIGNYNIIKASDVINKMSHEEVYKHLLKNLPYTETRNYLVKVNDRVSVYKKLLEEKI